MNKAAPRRHTSHRLPPWIVLILSLATIGMILGVDLRATHEDLTQREGERLAHAADVVGSTLSRSLQSTTVALDAIAPDLLLLLAGRDEVDDVNRRMEFMVSAMIGVRTLLLVDAGGTVLASNRSTLIGLNFQNDDRYQAIRDDPKPGKLYISPPFVTPHGVFTITAGKAVMRPDGSFAGYAVAAIDPDYFSMLLEASIYAPDMRTLLIHGAGRVIHCVPRDARILGSDLNARSDSLFRRHMQSGERKSLITGMTAITGENRLAAFVSVAPVASPTDQALVVSLSRDLDAVYAPWQRDLLVRSLLFGMLAVMSVAGLGVFQRHQWRNEAQLAAEEAERERLEEALHADRQYLADVVWGTDAGTWEWNLQTGAIHVNERWAGLLGYTLEELSPFSAETWRSLTHPDEHKMIDGLVGQLIAGRIDSVEVKTRRRHKDGHWVWILDRGRAVERDANGQALRLAGANLDISAIQTALHYARSLLEASLDPLMTIGLDGRIMDVNEAAENLTGLPRDALIGRDFADCFTDAEHAREGWQQVFVAGRVRDYPLTLKHVDGALTEVLYNASVFRDENGNVAGAFAAARDVTPLRETQRRLERTNAEGQMLRRMSDMLQSCQAVDEGVTIIEAGLQQLFPSATGRIFTIDASGHLLMEVSRWGQDRVDHVAVLTPTDCWALRRSHVHDFGYAHSITPRCLHCASDTSIYLCLPLQAQGQPLGVIHLIPSGDPDTLARERELAETVADSLSLGLANLRLRENLQTLSMRDPLTGLYNRRFMEEGLQREISRAARAQRHLAVAMLDLDHFKRFNDDYGHDAGDAVLTAFASLMLGFRTGSDIACRYGGEEFLLVLTDIDRDHARQRLDDFRNSVTRLVLHHRGQALPGMTVSIGLALFPDHGRHAAELVTAADQALYRAKHSGRNRVVLAGEGDEGDAPHDNAPPAPAEAD